MGHACGRHFNPIADLLLEVLTPVQVGEWFLSPHPRLADRPPGEVICVVPDRLLLLARRDLNRLQVQPRA